MDSVRTCTYRVGARTAQVWVGLSARLPERRLVVVGRLGDPTGWDAHVEQALALTVEVSR